MTTQDGNDKVIIIDLGNQYRHLLMNLVTFYLYILLVLTLRQVFECTLGILRPINKSYNKLFDKRWLIEHLF